MMELIPLLPAPLAILVLLGVLLESVPESIEPPPAPPLPETPLFPPGVVIEFVPSYKICVSLPLALIPPAPIVNERAVAVCGVLLL